MSNGAVPHALGRRTRNRSLPKAWYPSLLGALAATALVATAARCFVAQQDTSGGIREVAIQWLKTLDEKQRAVAVLPYDSPRRVDWHFIPKAERKGLQIRDMTAVQRRAALQLLRACLSQVGYDKATKIMALEKVLHELEKSRQGGPLRDPERYYFTLFGRPDGTSRWAVSIEGHHLSLNFVLEGDMIISSTPAVFAANPAIMKSQVAGVPAGLRVLDKEETLAFDLLRSISPTQRAKAIIAQQPLREVRAAGEAQPPQEPPQGLPASDMTDDQRALLRALVQTYADTMPSEVAAARMEAIARSGWENVHFAWAGADRPGVGHYYRIQGPTFLIEFVNTQPDAAGNPANHIHSLWRDMRGDFAIPVQGE